MGPKQVNNVIRGMSETGTAHGEGEGIAREGNESKAKEEKEKKAAIRKRLIEKTGERGEGASVKTKAITRHTMFLSFRLSAALMGACCELSAERTCVFSDLIINRMVPA